MIRYLSRLSLRIDRWLIRFESAAAYSGWFLIALVAILLLIGALP